MRSIILSLLLIFGFTAEASNATGLSVGITQRGLSYVVAVAIPMLESKLASVSIPDFSFNQDSVSGSLSGVTCSGLKVGSAVLTPSPGQGLSLAISGISVSCTGSWGYRENVWPHVPHGSGSVRASVGGGTGASVVVAVTQGVGMAHVDVASVSCSVDVTDVQFDGGVSGWILNLFHSTIQKKVGSLLQGKISDEIRSWVDTDANAILAKYVPVVKLPLPAPFNVAELDFSLVADPDMAAGFVDVALRGEGYRVGAHAEPPFPPFPLPPLDGASAGVMAELRLSAYLLESTAYVFFAAGVLSVTVTDGMLPASSPLRLNTQTFGGDAPGLIALYPNNTMQVAVTLSDRPTLPGDGQIINVTVPLLLKFGVNLANGSVADAFTIGCRFVGGLSVGVANGERLVGNVSFLSCRIVVLATSVGPIDDVNLNGLAAFVLDGVVLPLVNTKLAGGFPLPSLDGVAFTNSVVGLSSVCAGIKGAFCLPSGVCSSSSSSSSSTGWAATPCSAANAGAYISVSTDLVYTPTSLEALSGPSGALARLRGGARSNEAQNE